MPTSERRKRNENRERLTNLRSPSAVAGAVSIPSTPVTHRQSTSTSAAGAVNVPSTPVTHRQSTSTPMFDFPEQGRQPESPSSSESDDDLPVAFDPLLLEPPPASPRRRRGRPPKRQDNTKKKRSGEKETTQCPTPRLEPPSTSRGEALRVKLTQKHQQKIEAMMEQLMNEFSARPWPTKKRRSISADRTKTRCRGDCTCGSFAQCQQNANSYIKAAKYMAACDAVPHNIPQLKGGKVTQRCHNKHSCAAAGARHQVDYFDSGQFGDAFCEHCDARLLLGEAEQIKKGRKTPCCHGGDSHTETMKAEFDELQNPPKILAKDLAGANDTDIREEFLNNAMPLNNTFAFASVRSEKAPDDQMGGRLDTCKYNGEFSFLFSDLIAPQGRRPTFAQVYTLSPEAALNLREENVSDALGRTIKHLIMLKMEELMRQNPFGKTFQTAGKRVEQAQEIHGGELPRFQIVLLSDRDLQCDALKRRGDITVIERADAPTAKQVAVIWVQEDGLAPKVNGFWVCDQAGKMRELKSGMPQLDPCCFPLLHPKGTLGYRWFMKKRGRGEKLKAHLDEVVMQDQLDDARIAELENVQQEEEQDFEVLDEEMPEPACDLDADDPDEQGRDDVVNEHDTVLDPEVDCATQKGPITRDNISERDFYRYRMAMRMDSRDGFHWLWFARRLAEYFVISVLNRIERNEMDQLKKIQEQKNYRHILARDYINAIEKGLKKQGRNARLGKVFLMPQTFAGSRQYYQKKYADLMTVVRHLGNPTWFVTFTGNPQWPEIQSALQGRQSYTQRPDIVCRIFMDKATEFVKDVTQRHVLGKVAGWCYSVEHQKRGMPHIHILLISDKQGRITTPDEVDEFVCARVPALPSMDDESIQAVQQRRLWSYVTGMMMHDCNKACMEKRYNRRRGEEEDFCKKNFPKPYSDRTELSEIRYTNYVRLQPEFNESEENEEVRKDQEQDEQRLLEQHLLPENDPERDWNEVRYRRLPKKGRAPVRAYETCSQTFQKKRRRGGIVEVMDDSRVIPYNPFLLLKFGCHVNIEYVFGQKACKYIFKYLLKGFEKAYVQVAQPRRGGKKRANGNQEEVYDYDEIAATFKVRYMTAMEAYLRLHSYKIVSLSHQIYTLSVHDEMGHTIVIEEGHEEQGRHKVDAKSRLTAFFQLCVDDPEARNLTYDRVAYYYSWSQPKRMWIKRRTPLMEDPAGAKMFVRVYTVSPKRFELYAIRALLLNRPGPTSFHDLKTIDGREFETFTDAAIHLGLLESDELHAGAMRDACAEKSNLKQLQHYFAMLLVHARPSDPQKLFDDFLDEMNPPAASNDPKILPKSMETRRGEVLRNLEYFFRCMGTSCSEIGLHGLPEDFDMERQTEDLEEGGLFDDFYGDDRGRKRTPQEVVRGQLKQLNEDQRAAFEHISNAILSRGDNRLFFVEGAGGCGKTFLYNVLIRWCLAGKLADDDPQEQQGRPTLKSGSVMAAASTGIAALLLIGGGTVHRLFSVPNDVDDDVPPKTSAESAGAKRLRDAELIIIDEISMLNSKVLRYVDRTLQDVCGIREPFGGKVVVLGGDWRQLAPVVEHGTREDQVVESIKMDQLFKSFRKISLKVNMRTGRDELALRDWLHQIGNGLHQAEAGRKQGRPKNMLPIPDGLVLKDLNEAIDFCFPPELFADPMRNADAIAHNAVLCPTNLDVQAINDLAMERMHGHAGAFLSVDEPLEPRDELGTFRTDFNLETVHNELPSGLPPHKLVLKNGAPVMLIRNLDVTQGLCNGTRLQVKKMGEENLICRILTGPKTGRVVIIPKVKFEYGQGRHHRGLRFRRLQFPVRPCFAMTVNKAQGQTLQRMALVLNGRQCFSHGQVYVAMSRVTSISGIRVYSPSTCRGGRNAIENVVYHELLDDSQVDPRPQHTDSDPIAQAGAADLRDLESDEEMFFD